MEEIWDDLTEEEKEELIEMGIVAACLAMICSCAIGCGVIGGFVYAVVKCVKAYKKDKTERE